MEGVGDLGREETGVEAGGGRMLLNGGEDVVGLLEEEGADENEKTLGLEGAGTGEKKSCLEMLDGCEPNKLGYTDMTVVNGPVGRVPVRRLMWRDVVEDTGF